MAIEEEILTRMRHFLNTLDSSERDMVMQHMEIRPYRRNEIIYREGDTPSQLLCLVAGKVKIYKDGVGGRSQIVRVVNAVEYFGYRAAFSCEDYITGAAAFEDSLIVCIPISLIQELIQKNTRLACFFIRRLADFLGQSDARTVNLTQKHIRGRLAESILFLKKNYGVEADGCTLSIYLSREDLANLSNMTTNNAIRTLSNFAQENLIAVDGRKIKLINEPELHKISANG